MESPELIPVHTRILTNKDNIVEAIKEYAQDIITNKDIAVSYTHLTLPTM